MSLSNLTALMNSFYQQQQSGMAHVGEVVVEQPLPVVDESGIPIDITTNSSGMSIDPHSGISVNEHPIPSNSQTSEFANNDSVPSDVSYDINLDASQNQMRKRSIRNKYTRPCDACSLRKVKCDLNTPCSRCTARNLPCTNNRVRKKCGPKHLHKKTRDIINEMSRNPELEQPTENCAVQKISQDKSILHSFTPSIRIEKSLSCLHVYQTWYYGVWPVISVAHLMSRLVRNNRDSGTTSMIVGSDSLTAYALSCALSAAIMVQATFFSSNSDLIKLPTDVEPIDFANEALKARELSKFRMHPTPDTLLTSFFLYAYYINLKGGTTSAIVYLREAISIAQILGLHNESTYLDKPSPEVHRLRKIYYMLLVTERFMCIEDDVPVILEPLIPFPSINDEEYSTLICGFIELIKVFAIPDKKFFDRIALLKFKDNNPIQAKELHSSSNSYLSSSWIVQIQQQLDTIQKNNEVPEVQKVNIIVSKYWMKSLIWHLAKKFNLLLNQNKMDPNDILSGLYPTSIAKRFLEDVSNLPLFAFELNGPGACFKIVEIADGLIDSIILCGIRRGDNHVSYGYLRSIFNLISKLKNDLSLPLDIYHKIERFLIDNTSTNNMNGAGYISEISEEDEEERRKSLDSSISHTSPFTQMSMAFSMYPQGPIEMQPTPPPKRNDFSFNQDPAFNSDKFYENFPNQNESTTPINLTEDSFRFP